MKPICLNNINICYGMSVNDFVVSTESSLFVPNLVQLGFKFSFLLVQGRGCSSAIIFFLIFLRYTFVFYSRINNIVDFINVWFHVLFQLLIPSFLKQCDQFIAIEIAFFFLRHVVLFKHYLRCVSFVRFELGLLNEATDSLAWHKSVLHLIFV